MAYRNYDDGEYLLDGEKITVKDGAFELDGKTYVGFGYDDGQTHSVAHDVLQAACLPLSGLKSLWELSQGQTSMKDIFMGGDFDFLIDHKSLDHSNIERVDVPECTPTPS